MIDLDKTELHRVYRTEILGDTMVVTLQGDAAGFAIGAVHNEMVTLVNIARQPEVKHLVIDMSGSNYYGSLILGEIMNLGQAIKEKHGRCAIAGISNDMKEVLRMMRLDGMWERYPTMSMALRALADIPWQQKVKPYLKPVGITTAVVALLLAYIYVPRPDYTFSQYDTVMKVWDEAQKNKANGISETEWTVFAGRAKEKLAELTKVLEKTAGADRPAAQNLLYVTRDYAPNAIDARLKTDAEDTLRTTYHLALVKAHLDKTELPPIPKELGGDPSLTSNAPTDPPRP